MPDHVHVTRASRIVPRVALATLATVVSLPLSAATQDSGPPRAAVAKPAKAQPKGADADALLTANGTAGAGARTQPTAASEAKPALSPAAAKERARIRAIVLHAKHAKAEAVARDLKATSTTLAHTVAALLGAGYKPSVLPDALTVFAEAKADEVLEALQPTDLSLDAWVAILMARDVPSSELVAALVRRDIRSAAIAQSLRANKLASNEAVHAFAKVGVDAEAAVNLLLQGGYDAAAIASGMRAAATTGKVWWRPARLSFAPRRRARPRTRTMAAMATALARLRASTATPRRSLSATLPMSFVRWERRWSATSSARC